MGEEFNIEDFMTPYDVEQMDQANILDKLNDEQKAAAQQINGLMFVSAGPGAGKTRVLVSRAAYMISKGISPSSILLFTFTRKAANEIKQRVEKMLGDSALGVTVSTYHSFCARNLREYSECVGLKRNFSIVDTEDRNKILNEIRGELDLNRISNKISFYKDHCLYPSEAVARAAEEEDNNVEQLLAELYSKYQKKLRDNNSVDFDDLLLYMVKIMQDKPFVRQQLQNRYQYITADESQDSSIADAKFIFYLMNPVTKNLCLIGDWDQSIYGFRGANPNNLFVELEKYKYKKFTLSKNYRSTINIVKAAQSLIEYNNRKDKKVIHSQNDEGNPVYILSYPNQAIESLSVATYIEKLAEECSYDDIAILYRMNYLSRNMEDALIKKKIPYEIVNGTSFYSRREIKDIVSFIKFIVNPLNFIALERIINIPKRGIGEVTFKKINQILMTRFLSCAIIDSSNILTAFKDAIDAENGNSRVKKGMESFYRVLEHILEAYNNNPDPVDLIEAIVNAVNYREYIKKEDESGYEARMENIEELKNLASIYGSVADFLDNVMMLDVDPETEQTENSSRVKLMTMHASKGLEFKYVFIIAANEGVIPSARCSTREELEEERRLMYVAMTRAEELLIITNSNFMQVCGQMKSANPSVFLKQIDKDYVKSYSR